MDEAISKQINDIIAAAQHIVVVQADNPDGDSLASALALEHMLGDMGKQVTLYAGVDMPSYLSYLAGWDRVTKDLPNNFDASIVVDTSALDLLDSIHKTGHRQWLATRPCIVIDHHPVENSITFATVVCNQPAVATGQVLYELATKLNWPVNVDAAKMIAAAILSDSLGLTSEGTTARSIHIIGELVEKGVNLAAMEAARRDTMRKSPELVRYKGELLQRVEYYADNRIATITIPWEEIERYSHAYNPPMLVLDDMRLTEGTDVAIAFKLYRDGKITGKIRCNFERGIAAKLAGQFGGGGHVYAAGFKITDGRQFSDVKSECIQVATDFLNELPQANATV